MRTKNGRTSLVLAAVGAMLALAATAGAASTDVVATGLDNPRGIAVAPGKVLVAESLTGAITRLRGGKNHPSALATITNNVVDVAMTGHGWESYVVTGGVEPPAPTPPSGRKLYHVASSGDVELVADIGVYQAGDPDPDNADANPDTESNPNGLALLGDGRTLVADAANNDLLLVDADGHITTVARFKPETVPFGGGTVTVESVPTAVAIGPDGAYYVSELKGVPFPPGASRIWRIAPGSTGATCDPLQELTGPCTTVAASFSPVIDLTFGPDGTMYVLEIGLFHAPPPFGALWAVKNGVRTELVPGTLLAPGGVAVAGNGSIYVTTGTVFGPGAGSVVRVQP
jgi:glucose/arabinose dehydrogenase